MEPEKDAKKETKFTGEGIVNATEFGRMIGCSLNAVKRYFGTKLTEGVSWTKDKNKTLIDVGAAKKELMISIKPSNCKNKELLRFLDYELMPDGVSFVGKNDDVSQMTMQKVREEMQRSELRLSLFEERVKDGKYIERAVVEKNLEAMGIEIRNSFVGISARVTPAMRAAASDRDAENIIHKSVEDTLFTLSQILQKDISQST